MRPLTAVWLGTQPYERVFKLQRRLSELRKANQIEDVVLFLEHTPTVTLGRGADTSHLLASEQALQNLGIAVTQVDRGGGVTFHAPGQLVGYPILGLTQARRDVRRYVRSLIDTMRLVVEPFGVHGGQFRDHIGLWVDAASVGHWPGADAAVQPLKVGAVGVRISRWTTMHGFALNLTTNLEWFRLIIPCGIRDFGVTSVGALTELFPETSQVAEAAHEVLCDQMELGVGNFFRVDPRSNLLSQVLGAMGQASLRPAARPQTAHLPTE